MQSASPNTGIIASKVVPPPKQSSSPNTGSVPSELALPPKQSISPNAAAVASPTAQSTSQKCPGQTAEGPADDDVTSRQLDQIDSFTFSQSARSLRSKSSSRESSPGLAATVNLTRRCPLITASSPDNTPAAQSSVITELILKDAADSSGMKSAVENRSTLVTSTPADASPLSADNSRWSSPGSGPVDSVGNKHHHTAVPSTTQLDVESTRLASSGPRRLSSYLARLKSSQSPDSAPATPAEKSAGRGKTLLAVLKAHKTEVGASPSQSCPELTSGSQSQGYRLPHGGRKPPVSTNLEQMPEQIVLSSGLDEKDFESGVEPVEQLHLDGGRHGVLREVIQEQSHAGEGWRQVPEQSVAENQTSSKSSDYHSSTGESVNQCDVDANNTASTTTTETKPLMPSESVNARDVDVHNAASSQNTVSTDESPPTKTEPWMQPVVNAEETFTDHLRFGETVNPCHVDVGNTALVQNAVNTSMNSSLSPLPSVVSEETFSGHLPGEQAKSSTQPQSAQMGRSQTPQSCDSLVRLEQSPGSSTDVSLSSAGCDRPRMLTKRLPKVAYGARSRSETPVLPAPVLPGASRSNSRTGTPVPPPSRKSPSPLPHSTPSSATFSRAVPSRVDSFDVIPELRTESFSQHTTPPARDR